MSRHFSLPAVVAAVLSALPAHSQDRGADPPAPVVYVRGVEEGQGFTRPYRGECFVITPEHVVFGESRQRNRMPRRVYIVVEGGNQVDVRIMPRTSEFTILHVPDSVAAEGVCATPISIRRARRELRRLGPRREGALWERSPMGLMDHRRVSVSDRGDHAHLEVEGDLGRGTSGGLIYAGEVPVGVVLQTPTLRPGEQRTGGAEVYRLDHVETFIASFFRYRHRPTAGEVLGSVFVPGLGQRVTTRRELGWGWTLGTAAVVVVGAGVLKNTRTEMRTFQGDSLIPPQQYPYQVREYPLRRWEAIAAVWFGSGVASALETMLHVHLEYPRADGTAHPAAPNAVLRVTPLPVAGDGAMGLSLSLELKF